MKLLEKLKAKFSGKIPPEHLRRGICGERAAKKYLEKNGLKFLAANFRSARGEKPAWKCWLDFTTTHRSASRSR